MKKFNNKEQIKEILEMNTTDREKKNLVANIKNITTDLGRAIAVDQELELEIGQEWNNLGQATSWTDINKENSNFSIENNNSIEYVLRAENIEGYEVQYLEFETIFDELEEDGMDEEEAEEIAENLSEDETYLELMDLLGSDADMKHEAEVLVPSATKFEIVEINDSRDDEGYIEVILKERK